MKKILYSILALTIISVASAAVLKKPFSFVLAWDYVLPQEEVVFTVYRNVSDINTNFVAIKTVTNVLTAPMTETEFGVYKYYVTASNEFGESDPSNTVELKIAKPVPPGQLKWTY